MPFTPPHRLPHTHTATSSSPHHYQFVHFTKTHFGLPPSQSPPQHHNHLTPHPTRHTAQLKPYTHHHLQAPQPSRTVASPRHYQAFQHSFTKNYQKQAPTHTVTRYNNTNTSLPFPRCHNGGAITVLHFSISTFPAVAASTVQVRHSSPSCGGDAASRTSHCRYGGGSSRCI
ncbi:hypothetical protein E2C01_065247 [Portunus trituberculatus]|uniref:Uncharacterized protein n=1 Tax=Portunus trituberculatus TaxID=210409 RepID=A0A5B7HF41_PORTR|nr:hypothetical protein [Portunus trituberculatus]